MYLAASSKLTMVQGATLEIGGDFLYAYTDESRLVADEGILHMNGTGVQFLEAGSRDLGLLGSSSGNFGLGRLVVGDGREEAPATTVMLLDLMDNGNRIGETPEALYLYGVGGLDGLTIHEGSTLVLDGINVYAWMADEPGNWVHLNALFDEGVTSVPFSGGMVAIPEPSGLALIALAAAVFFLFRAIRYPFRDVCCEGTSRFPGGRGSRRAVKRQSFGHSNHGSAGASPSQRHGSLFRGRRRGV